MTTLIEKAAADTLRGTRILLMITMLQAHMLQAATTAELGSGALLGAVARVATGEQDGVR